MKAMILATGLAAVAGQATALSCMQADPAQTFRQVAAADERYVVLMGTFDFAALPRVAPKDINTPTPQSVVAMFEGQGLGATGFGPTTPREVTLQSTCAGPWCASFPPSGTEVLAFVEQTDAGYVLTLDPCGGSVFEPAVAPIVAACMRGESCEPALR